MGAVHLRHRRDLRRQRRLPPLRDRHHLRGARPAAGRRSRPRAPATAPGPAGRRAPRNCGAYMCGASGTLPRDLHDRRRLRRAQRLHGRQLRQAAQRRRLHRRDRVLERLLRAGGLLPDRLHRRLPILRDGRHAPGRARWCRRAPTRWASARTAAPPRAAPTAPATAAAPAGCTPAAPSASPQSCAGATFTPARTCNGTGTCQTTTASSCGTYACGTRRVQDVVHGRRRLRSRPTSVSWAPAPRNRPASLRRAQRVHVRILRAGHLLRAPPAPEPASRARWPGRSGACTNVPTGTDPLGQCTDQGANTCGTDGFCNGAGGCRRLRRRGSSARPRAARARR